MMNEYNPQGKDIRFIDSHYKTLFHIPDGGCIQVRYPDETVIKPCKYIDEYHTQIGYNVFHLSVCGDYGTQRRLLYWRAGNHGRCSRLADRQRSNSGGTDL